MSERFVVGQRWASATESELGLGIVDAVDGRRVEVDFPAAGDRRTYAVDASPLARVIYHVGERIRTADGRGLVVTRVHDDDDLIDYTGTDDAGTEHRIGEGELDSHARFGRPEQRLLAGRIDDGAAFALRMETLRHRHRHRASNALGIAGARIELLAHQLWVATQASARHAPRVLLADEVGLGKTIEAGLIVHRLIATGRAQRVLVLVPESLVHQWLVEMLRRFNLAFSILDEDRCESYAETGAGNPFDDVQLALCPLTLLSESEGRLEQARSAGWDVLVVDEAHHLRWRDGVPDEGYRCVERLAGSIASVIALTATPEQLGVDGHFARLRLLDPHRFHDRDAFAREEAGYRELGELVDALLSDDASGAVASGTVPGARLTELLGDEDADRVRAGLTREDRDRMAQETVDALLDRHGTGRVLYRNTRENVGGFPERRLVAHPLPAPEGFTASAAAVDLAARMRPETVLGADWTRADPRVGWLVDWLREAGGEKALVICALADTARALEEHLRVRAGVRSAVFHEGLGLVARDRAAAYFADREEGAQVLVCSEIGSEGRNFQFAHHLVLFDLPLEPDLLEQRIGRLDRIGQKQVVRIHVPHYRDTVQSRALRWLDEGIDAFTRPCAIGERVLVELGASLPEGLADPGDGSRFEDLVARTRKLAARLTDSLASGRDRLLELNSCRARPAAELVDALRHDDHDLALPGYFERALDRIGVEVTRLSAHTVLLKPGSHMIVPSIPGLPEDGVGATYDRGEALEREDLQFLSWDHPLVATVMDLLVEAGTGNASLGTAKLRPLKPGTVLVEATFAVHCLAPPALWIERFMTAALLRVVTDAQGRDLGETLTAPVLDRLVQPVPDDTALAISRRIRTEVMALIERAERLARPRCEALIESAVAAADTAGRIEIERLTTLARVNPSIDRDEIEHVRASTAGIVEHLGRARLELDALRLVIAT